LQISILQSKSLWRENGTSAEITAALVGETALPRLPEAALRRRIEALRFRIRLSPEESATLRRKGRK
jgi:hypothetical protein